MSSKRIVIHVGPGKTGSSALQAWLSANRTWLKQQSVYYPKHQLGKHTISSGHIHLLLSFNDGKWKVAPDKVDKVIKEFEKSGCDTLLLSSEYFFHNIKALMNCIPQAEFVAYIRNPVELIESGYNQSVKRHSAILPFTAPQSVEKLIWPYLTDIAERIDPVRLILRPYDYALFHGGSIITDLLSLMDITAEYENQVINSSYTLPALEYKRLLNHFGLGTLEESLDNLLQGYSAGKQNYSLIRDEDFARLNQQNTQKMREFIRTFKRYELRPLLRHFMRGRQRIVAEHHSVGLSELQAVDEFIRTCDAALHEKLVSKVSAHPNLLIDNLLIYKLFGVEPTPPLPEDSILVDTAEAFPIIQGNRGKVLFELAQMYHKQGQLTEALRYARVCVYFNPENERFVQLVNRLVIESNHKTCPDGVSLTSERVSAFGQVKNKLFQGWVQSRQKG